MKFDNQEKIQVGNLILKKSIPLFNLLNRCYEYGLDLRQKPEMLRRIVPLNVTLVELVQDMAEFDETLLFGPRNTMKYLTGKIASYVSKKNAEATQKGTYEGIIAPEDITGVPVLYRAIINSLFEILYDLYELFNESDMLGMLTENELKLLTRAYSNPNEFYVKTEGERPDQQILPLRESLQELDELGIEAYEEKYGINQDEYE